MPETLDLLLSSFWLDCSREQQKEERKKEKKL